MAITIYLEKFINFNNMTNLNEEDIKKILSNPFYCLSSISPIFCEEHEPMITEEAYIKGCLNLIEEIGAEDFLRNLLENLKGNYV
jgi:hypothetical protein